MYAAGTGVLSLLLTSSITESGAVLEYVHFSAVFRSSPVLRLRCSCSMPAHLQIIQAIPLCSIGCLSDHILPVNPAWLYFHVMEGHECFDQMFDLSESTCAPRPWLRYYLLLRKAQPPRISPHEHESTSFAG